MEAVDPQAPAKVDPETLVIRGRPPRAIRFKREAIIAIAACGSISLTAVAWLALKPHIHVRADAQQELAQPQTSTPTDALAGAPATYGDVPKLGPPLPGDLGKPILEHQEATMASIGTSDQRVQQAAATERDRQLADLKAARESGILVQNRQGAAPVGAAIASTTEPAVAPVEALKPALEPERDPNSQGQKTAFVGTLDSSGDANPHGLTPPGSPYMLSAGSVIAASLVTGLRSDLPGLVTAQVTENTYDSATGRILLIPQGARLVGAYYSVVAYGQSRALIVWQRIIMPDSASLRIDNLPATDAAGYSGLSDKIDLHTWQLLKGISLSTLLGVGSDLALSGQSDLVQAVRMSTQDNVSRAGDQITQRNLGVQPTVTIRPGTPVRLVVHKDLIFNAPQR